MEKSCEKVGHDQGLTHGLLCPSRIKFQGFWRSEGGVRSSGTHRRDCLFHLMRQKLVCDQRGAAMEKLSHSNSQHNILDELSNLWVMRPNSATLDRTSGDNNARKEGQKKPKQVRDRSGTCSAAELVGSVSVESSWRNHPFILS